MKNILLLLFLLLPIASFAEETADDMTTIFEEHFDGWLYLHETGMNATYEYKTASLQSYTIKAVPDDVPCLKLNSGSFIITISNNTGAYGDFILYFKDHNKNTEVSIWQGNKYNTIKANDNDNETYTINVAKGTKQIKLSFKTKDNPSKAYIDNIILKAPTSSIATSPDAKLSFNQQEMSAAISTTYNSSQLLSNPNSLPIKWYSSNQATATVDTSGNVTPHFIGTTTIYAIFEGNNNYAYQAVSSN